MNDEYIMHKIGYISRMMHLLAINKEEAEKVEDILENATYEGKFRDLNEQEIAYVKELAKRYNEKVGESIVDSMADIFGEEVRAYLSEFEVV